MGEGKCSPGPWKAIENSWQYTTIYDAHDREICRLDLERFEDLNEETQDKYEAIQRADAAAIVLACDHDAALRRAKAEGMREIRQLRRHLRVALDHAEQHHEGCLYCGEGEIVDGDTTPAHRAKCWYYKASRAAQIEEGDK